VTRNEVIRPGGLRRNNPGPRRTRSIGSYLRHTRALAGLVLAAVIASVASDLAGGSFWERHALVTGLVASVIVVMLSVAIVNEVLERRRRQRWSVLAQYVMLEMVRSARMVWTEVLDLAGLLPTEANQQHTIELGAQIVQDAVGSPPLFGRWSMTIMGEVVCTRRSASSPTTRTKCWADGRP
jgi:hypothetical protein